jgi:uncharacterized membrane protein (UPF0127 family)
MKKFFLLAVFIFGAIFFTPSYKGKGQEKPYLTINNRQIWLEIAQTPDQKAKGLGHRKSLAKNWGMLFVYSQPGPYPFWMKGMKFNLDFVFINGIRVVDLVENVPCPQGNQEPQAVRAKKPFDKALETNAGVINELDIKVGNLVTFSF